MTGTLTSSSWRKLARTLQPLSVVVWEDGTNQSWVCLKVGAKPPWFLILCSSEVAINPKKNHVLASDFMGLGRSVRVLPCPRLGRFFSSTVNWDPDRYFSWIARLLQHSEVQDQSKFLLNPCDVACCRSICVHLWHDFQLQFFQKNPIMSQFFHDFPEIWEQQLQKKSRNDDFQLQFRTKTQKEHPDFSPAICFQDQQIVGDDLLVTNPNRIKKALEVGACNALLLKVNQLLGWKKVTFWRCLKHENYGEYLLDLKNKNNGDQKKQTFDLCRCNQQTWWLNQ